MEKINRALYASEENAANIAELRAQMKARTASAALTGTADGEQTLFGVVTAYCPASAIVVFEGESVRLTFGDAVIAEGSSPLIAVLPEGKGALALSAVRNGARAVVTGAKCN